MTPSRALSSASNDDAFTGRIIGYQTGDLTFRNSARGKTIDAARRALGNARAIDPESARPMDKEFQAVKDILEERPDVPPRQAPN